MTLFREHDRLKQDSRILIISDPADFALYRDRGKLKIKGIMMPYNISGAALEAARFCSVSSSIPKTAYNYDRGKYKGSHYEQCRLVEDQKEILPLLEISKDLSAFFYAATGVVTTNSFRINSNYPNRFHEHRTAMSLGILKSGTVCLNETGEEYTIPNGYVLLCEDISHRAPQEENEPDDGPRATFVVIYDHPLGV
jgi:hypothetical protein